MVYNDIDDFLNFHDGDGVVFTCGNYGVVSLIKNLIASARKVNLDVVVFAFDEKLVDALKGLCTTVRYIDPAAPESFCEYGTEGFNKVVFHRFVIGNTLLRAGKSYTYMDVDIVVKKDFTDDIQRIFETTDTECLIQMDGAEILGCWDYDDKTKPKTEKKWKNWWWGHSPNVSGKNWWKRIVDKWGGGPRICCTGFYSMKPTENTIALFSGDLSEFLESNGYQPEWNDQDFFNIKIFRGGIHDGLKVDFLDRNFYPNGDWYYEFCSEIDSSCKIIHFNGVLGLDAKIENMKKFGYYENLENVEIS